MPPSNSRPSPRHTRSGRLLCETLLGQGRLGRMGRDMARDRVVMDRNVVGLGGSESSDVDGQGHAAAGRGLGGGRVTSLPDQREVEEVRQLERERGGPAAPHNSLELSVVVLDDSQEEELVDLPVFENVLRLRWSPTLPSAARGGYVEVHDGEDYGEEILDVLSTPPPQPLPNSLLGNELEAQDSPERQNLELTIDLTDSPDNTTATVGSAEDLSGPSSIKCPICFDSLEEFRVKGSTLVSTVCGHLFCSLCLPTCLMSRPVCPTCRARCSGRDFHPVFLN